MPSKGKQIVGFPAPVNYGPISGVNLVSHLVAIDAAIGASFSKYWDAVVGPAPGPGIDFTTITAAIGGGAKRIFILNGTYTEAPLGIFGPGMVVVGESISGTIINATFTLGHNSVVRNITVGNGGVDQCVVSISGDNCLFENIILNSNSTGVSVKLLVSGNKNLLRNIQEVAGTTTLSSVLVIGNDNKLNGIFLEAINAHISAHMEIGGERNELSHFRVRKGSFALVIRGPDHVVENGDFDLVDNSSGVSLQSNVNRLIFAHHRFRGMLAVTGFTRAVRIDGHLYNSAIEDLDMSEVVITGSSFFMYGLYFEPGLYVRRNISVRNISAKGDIASSLHYFAHFPGTAVGGNIDSVEFSHIVADVSTTFFDMPGPVNGPVLTGVYFNDIRIRAQNGWVIKGGPAGGAHRSVHFANITLESNVVGGRIFDFNIPAGSNAQFFHFENISASINVDYLLYIRGTGFYRGFNFNNLSLMSTTVFSIDVELSTGGYLDTFNFSNFHTGGQLARLSALGTAALRGIIFSSFTGVFGLTVPYITLVTAVGSSVKGIIVSTGSIDVVGSPVTLFTGSGAGVRQGQLHAITYKATPGVSLSDGTFTTPNNNDTYPV